MRKALLLDLKDNHNSHACPYVAINPSLYTNHTKNSMYDRLSTTYHQSSKTTRIFENYEYEKITVETERTVNYKLTATFPK